MIQVRGLFRCPMEAWLIDPPSSTQKKLERSLERGWGKPLVRVALGSCEAVELHSSVSALDAQMAVVRAMHTWNRAMIGVQFELTESIATADILVNWLFSHSDPEGQLGSSVQAHADYPPGNSLFGFPLPLHFNADFLWGIQQPGCFDIETIALHELAHLLGLIYHTGHGSIMYDALGPAPFFVLHTLDTETIARARRLHSSLLA